MIYFFDFDGTVVDVWKRYYSVFVEAGKLSNIGFDEYKITKKALIKDIEVARAFGQSLNNDYFENKAKLLEEKRYLDMDSLIVNPLELIDFFRSHNCFFLTKRRNPANFLYQINKLGLGEIANKTIVINPDQHTSKYDYFVKNKYDNFVIVGDSSEELEASNIENANVVLVETGLFQVSSFYTKKRNNCRVIDNLNTFLKEN